MTIKMRKADALCFVWQVDKEHLDFDKQVAEFLEKETGFSIEFETDYLVSRDNTIDVLDEYVDGCKMAQTLFTTYLNDYINGVVQMHRIKELVDKTPFHERIKFYKGI